MQNNVAEYKSVKSNSTYTVTTENGRAYLGVTGEASTNRRVLKEIERVRTGGGDFDTVAWTARMLANEF